MPRKPRTPRIVKHKLSPDEIAYLTDAAVDDEGFTLWSFRHGMEAWGVEPRTLWEKHRDEFLPAFIREHPGRRPTPWWQWDAPRQADQGSGFWYEGTLPEPRRRLGGIGTPAAEVLAVVPAFAFGIPTGWVTQFEADYHGSDFAGKPIDPADPPTFESEAAYLRRRRLLTPAERAHLRAHPELLTPEAVTIDKEEGS